MSLPNRYRETIKTIAHRNIFHCAFEVQATVTWVVIAILLDIQTRGPTTSLDIKETHHEPNHDTLEIINF